MNDHVANTTAIACHINARVRGIACPPIAQSEVVFKCDRAVEFWGAKRKQLSKWTELQLVSTDPDGWIDDQVNRGVTRASIAYTPSANGTRKDRNTAGFVGGGGKFLLVLHRRNRTEFWHAMTKVEDKDDPDQKIWKTGFFVASSQSDPPPTNRSVALVSSDLRNALVAIHAFAVKQDIVEFARTFQESLDRLDSEDPLAGSYYRPAIPEGLLSLDALRLFGAAELPFVFGAMGSWNDLGFHRDTSLQEEYDTISDRLFGLSNEAVCAAVNDGVPS
ncbi:MAG: hypothetical protein NXI14_11400 [bacterium]|nr:hypothetical protein [bacterium]